MSNTHIAPSIGRVVWYFPSGHDTIEQGPDGQPLAAMVAYVWPDGSINIAVHDWHGYPWSRSKVRLVQDGEEVPEGSGYATWMPFQIGQAKKAESDLQQRVAELEALVVKLMAPTPVSLSTGEILQRATYADGTTATGTAPLPTSSPAEQAAAEATEHAQAPATKPATAAKTTKTRKAAAA